jgi:predicted nucleotidyltransferase
MQACIAYCYITTPLIESSLARIKLYLYVSEVALAMNLISQSSSLLKMSISQLLELEANNDE